jgi:hypothetical protein
MQQGSAAQRIPRAIQQIAEDQGLGPSQAVYQPAKDALLYRLLGLGVMSVGGLILLAFLLTYNSIFIWLSQWLGLLVLVVAVGWISIGAWIALTPSLYPHMRVFACPEGLICLRRDVEVILWHQIEKLWKDIARDNKGRDLRAYIVRCKDGRTIVFDNALRGIEDLGGRLEREVTRRHLPQTITSYVQGVPLIFGEIIVSEQGIGLRRGRKIRPWSEVENITIDETQVGIYGKDEEPLVVSVARVPNVGILQELIAYTRQQCARAQLPQVVAYNAGLPVCFGRLSLSQQGLELDNGQLLPWSEVASVGVGKDEIIIRRKSATGDWYALPLWMVSDPAGLKDLVDYIMLHHAFS